MDDRFIEAFFNAYTIPMDLLLMIGLICFFKLPKELRANVHYWLPLLIVVLSVLFQNVGFYTNYNYEFKKSVNAFLGNTQYPQFNLWLFNITDKQIGVLLFLGLIRIWLAPSKRIYISWMMYIFVVAIVFLQLSGIELMYLHQPIIFALGANMILVGCGLYFIGMITQEEYLDSNPLKLVSFWQMTFIMFTFSLSYISSVALFYLYKVNPVLGESLQTIGDIMSIVTLGILTLSVASPHISRIFEKEPSYESN